MKELSIEEKAKRYDEAYKKVAVRFGSNVADEIFPELKESEDERIRKAIINIFAAHKDYEIFFGVSVEDILAWLKKHGEQKPNPCDGCTNRKGCINCENGELRETEQKSALVEPKFKVGDKIISTISNIPYYITEVCNGHYLTDVGCIIMFNAQNNFKLVEQKPAWSEEDEVKINRIVACLENLNVADNDILLKDVEWLKSLRPQNRWKPSEEQMEAVKCAVLDISKFSSRSEQLRLENEPYYKALVSLYNDLKKLKQ